ncbi:RNF14 ligase, partial [Caloenas nicobarica]|nr:RNF14 ligase [Caloenas nicobarica]
MSSEDKEAQEDELLALASIYDEDVFKRSESAQGGETRIFLELPQDFIISVNGNSAETLRSTRSEYTVSFLPPLVLNFELPPDYPSTSPPVFTLRGKWLSRAQVCRIVLTFEQSFMVLFAWMQFLKEETLSYLKISSPYELKMCHGGSGQSGPPLEPADAEQC